MNSSPPRRQVRCRPVLRLRVRDGDAGVVEADDAGVGDGDAEDIAGEVVEHGLLALSPGGDVGDPVGVPDRVGDDEVGHRRRSSARTLPRTLRASALIGSRKLRRAGCQVEPSAERPPPLTRQWTMRVQVEPLVPGVQHREHGDGAADEARIAGDLDDGGGGGLHQHGVAVALMGRSGARTRPAR